ncbi:MAG: helix-turn-helix transcriptional regulator [Bacteroidota bacterium]
MIKVYRTIAAFAASIGQAFDQDFDFTIHRIEELHGEGAVESPPFRTEYHAFLLVESGKGSYTIDQASFPLKSGSFYFTNPGHVKSFKMAETIRGYIITFTDRFLQSHYAGKLSEAFPFLYDQTVPVLQLPAPEFTVLQRQAEGLMTAYHAISPFRARILAHQMIAFLYATKEILLRDNRRLPFNSRAEELAIDFHRRLNDYILQLNKGNRRPPQVQELAEAMKVQPAYLSEVLKSTTGKNPKDWIDERVLTEAQTLLLNTTNSVAEIAYRLGWEDASNFSRFFRRRTGKSPTVYRKLKK